MTTLTAFKSAWKSAQLYVAFYKDQNGRRRRDPWFWKPKNGVAGIPDDPKDKEAVLVIQGYGDAGEVQIKAHPKEIVVRRDPGAIGWDGIIIDHYGLKVRVGETWITVAADGSVRRDAAADIADTSYIEADGAFLRLTPDMEITVSGDGEQLVRRTCDDVAYINGVEAESRPRRDFSTPLAYEDAKRLPKD